MSTAATTTRNPLDLFVQGAKQGWNIAAGSMLPYVIMAFVIIEVLKLTNILTLIGKFAAPIMVIWGLPGEALIVICAAALSRGGSIGVAASLIGDNTLSGIDASILAPAIMLIGGMVQQTGRILGTSESSRRYWGWHILISCINAMIGMWMVRFFMFF